MSSRKLWTALKKRLEGRRGMYDEEKYDERAMLWMEFYSEYISRAISYDQGGGLREIPEPMRRILAEMAHDISELRCEVRRLKAANNISVAEDFAR